jgi:hypothetical protein
MSSQEGKKFDGEKPALYFNPPEIQYGMARAFMHGAKKYGSWNWMGGITTTRLAAALMRHLLQWMWEQTPDSDSGLDHLDHAAASLAMLMDTVKRRPDLDDRPPIKKPPIPGGIQETNDVESVINSYIIPNAGVANTTDPENSRPFGGWEIIGDGKSVTLRFSRHARGKTFPEAYGELVRRRISG